jgi:shikimate kinase
MKTKIILLMGPSGVGKSTVADALSKTFLLPVYNTDNIIKRNGQVSSISEYRSLVGEDQFCFETRDVIDHFRANSSNNYILFDSGAGSLDSNIEWFKKFYRICLIDDNMEKLWKRRKKDHESVDHYESI